MNPGEKPNGNPPSGTEGSRADRIEIGAYLLIVAGMMLMFIAALWPALGTVFDAPK